MLSLPTTLTQDQSTQCLEDLRQHMVEQDGSVVVCAAGLTEFDSSALAVLLGVRRECERLGKGFAVQNMPKRLCNLATLYGIETLLPRP